MKTINQFLIEKNKLFRNSEYVYHKDFKSLYLRKGIYTFIDSNNNNFRYSDTIVIANITSKNPGKGYFSKLINELSRNFPEKPIFIECVLEERFQNKLERMGFEKGKSDSLSENCFAWNLTKQNQKKK